MTSKSYLHIRCIDNIYCDVPRYCYLKPPPFTSNENIAQLITAYYPVTKINPQSIKFLGGFDDHIYYVKGSTVGSDSIKEFVFKVMVETDPDYFDAMTKLMVHLNKEGINVPFPIASINDNIEFTVPLKKSHIVKREVEDDTDYTGFLLTYLPGNILSSVQRSPKLLYNIGGFVGRLNSVLQVSKYIYSYVTVVLTVATMFLKRNFMSFDTAKYMALRYLSHICIFHRNFPIFIVKLDTVIGTLKTFLKLKLT